MKRIKASLIALLMIIIITPSHAKAQSVGELQQMINDLLAQVAMLQEQVADLQRQLGVQKDSIEIRDIQPSMRNVVYSESVRVSWELSGDLDGDYVACVVMENINTGIVYVPFYPGCLQAEEGVTEFEWLPKPNWPPAGEYRIEVRVLDEDDGSGKDRAVLVKRSGEVFSLKNTDKVYDTDGDGWFYGTDSSDYYEGDHKENIFVGSPGNDYIRGDGDWDEVNYVGINDCADDFSITYDESDLITIESTKYGTDMLRSIEGVYFVGCGGQWQAF